MKRFHFHRTGALFGLLVAAVAGTFGAPLDVQAAALSTQTAANFQIDPPLGVAGAAPLVMLNLSRDHQLFYKAYNDFTDINNDGVLDTTYTNDPLLHPYVGYFDPTKCYAYDSGAFVPQGSLDATNYCTAQWSGNFLNWATMTRMDEVRKILYGGMRSTDTKKKTILERAYLPTDAHSFAKFYNGSDIAKLTPFSYGNTRPTATGTPAAVVYDQQGYNDNGSNNSPYVLLRLQYIPNSLGVQLGDQIQIVANNSTSAPATLTAPVRYLNSGGYGNDGMNNRVELRVQAGMFANMPGCGTVDQCVTQFRSYAQWTATNLTRTGITLCNTTMQAGSDQLSQNNTAAPKIRVVPGDYALWAANEKLQCQWYSEQNTLQSGFIDGFMSNGNRAAFSGLGSSGENPSSSLGNEYIARVQVCVSKALLGTENCKQYPDDKTASNPYKPIGLLQKYGETGNIKFGLVTPTFDHNASGGVLRAALPGPGTNDGDFVSNEINSSTGQFITGAAGAGIISNINALRIYGYKYEAGNNYGDGNGCSYQQTGITTGKAGGTLVSEGNCSSWGNPMAESYIETLRYLAGQTPTSSFASGTEDAALGMSVVATWNDPISPANFCAALNVINFNASSLSYDTDAVSGFDDLNTGRTVSAWTDLVGTGEGIPGKSWFVGNSSSTYADTDKDLCSAKSVANFSDLQGICPESPALKGGYLMAGAAYGAHVKRIRDLGLDTSNNPVVATSDKTSLKVNTFGVQLATNTPQIRVAVPGSTNKFVTIIPAYRLVLDSGVGGGALVDFKVLSQTVSGGTATGSFYASWEDSFAGGDYDQDMWGIISYEITATKVKVTTRPVAASTSNGQGFGYIVNGTTKDGPHFHSGIYGFKYTDATNPDIYNTAGTRINNSGTTNASGGCNGCTVSDGATTAIYDVGASNAGTLQDPLLYASKWGGFRVDTTKPDGTDTPVNDANPADNSKWASSTRGATPDNYFLVTDPGALEASLDALFRKILAKTASGTAAATVATSANGVGVTYQALYEAERTDNSGDRATWIGSMSSLWTDKYGYLREDGNHNNQLDDYATDPVIKFEYQASNQRTVAMRYTTTSSDPTIFTQGAGVPVELTDINSIWNARQGLWDPTLKTDSASQRTYTSAFSNANGRYIFTWIDANNDGKVDTGEMQPFIYDTTGTTGFNSTNYRRLNTDSTTEAANIVNWIRGSEITGLRSRTVDYGTTTALVGRVTRLGDIVNSTPLALSAPAESYDLLYNDQTYAAFRTKYRDRRQVVYVGANDGMIHAFNAGFYNASCQRFTTQPNNATCTATTPNATGTASSTPTAHPLGAELWAYVPKNLQAHLRWLTDPNYRHIYYVDGSPIAVDAKIFTADTDHPNGWGTVLVVPFRLGGGPISVNIANSGTASNQGSDSAYVIMDVTNPEVAPKVMGEVTLPNTWTTSVPAGVMVRDATTGSPSKFFLAFGSGPTDQKKVASTANLKVRVYDLADFVGASAAPTPVTFDLGTGTQGSYGKNSFAGDLIASDFNLDGKSEALYFGSVTGDGTSAEFGGNFYRIFVNGNPDPNQWDASKPVMLALNTTAMPNGMPVTIRPTLGRNLRGAPLVYFGTGRLFTTADKATSGQQRIFGLIDTALLPSTDAQYSTSITQSKLINVTGIDVATDATQAVSGLPSGVTALNGVTNFPGLTAAFNAAGVAGWYRDLSTKTNNPSERVVSSQTLLGALLLTAAYTPGTAICTGLGTSQLYGQNYATGTGDPSGFFGSSGGKAVVTSDLGSGLPAPPAMHVGDGSSLPGGGKTVTACTQTSTGAIVCKDVATLKPVTSGESSWREPLGN
ncbi:hypothetical protein FIV34_15045 [Luteibacter pinisoli]|uniref:PilC beta-propeller domain-containing protein n=1 Tax=Luteibacter pinisoli TaxID=2589080 RepID=A0A4Y5Z667_9GAMM|nr:hypothetical protein [Luteibacter pinisoli]QDE40426.1 hypothetical protein FIV34_15045 [Luteibacter pinisoli]